MKRKVEYNDTLSVKADNKEVEMSETNPTIEENEKETEEHKNIQAKKEVDKRELTKIDGEGKAQGLGTILFLIILFAIVVAFVQYYVVKLVLQAMGVPNAGAISFFLLFILPILVGRLRS